MSIMTDSQRYDVKDVKLETREMISDESETAADPQAILVSSPPSDPISAQRMKAIEFSGSLRFWDRPEEDKYTIEDGEPA